MRQEKEIMTPEEVARYLNKILSWVYKNKELLGGMKVGGAVFFPNKQDIYNRIFSTKKKTAIKPEKFSSNKQIRSDIYRDNLDPNRHGLLNSIKKKGRTIPK